MTPIFVTKDDTMSLPWYGPISLSQYSVETLPEVITGPSPKSIPDSIPVLASLTSDKKRGYGAVWHTWSAVSTAFSPEPSVLKACHVGDYEDEDDEQYTRSDVARAIRHEYDLLTGPLSPLQDLAVPGFLGCFVAPHKDGPVWAFLMRDVGNPLEVDLIHFHQK
jgi:hypothetical protein